MPIATSPRALITGAGSGLGRAFCFALSRHPGARVLCADIDEASARQTAAEIGSAAIFARCDVARVEDVEALARTIDQAWGGVDLVINNAGVAVGGAVGEVPLDDWRWIVGVNFWGVVHGCHVFAPRLRQQGSGHILNVASAAGLLSPPGMAPYNATKAAVIALSETLRGELRGTGVGVTVLCPTFFQTNIAQSARSVDKRPIDMVQKRMATAKIQADDVARLALDCCARDELYALPHADGRWMWRIKRWAPSQYAAIVARVVSRIAR